MKLFKKIIGTIKKKLEKASRSRYVGLSLVETLITIVIITTVMLLASITLTTLIKVSAVSAARTTAREESEFVLELIRRTVRNSHTDDLRVYRPTGRYFDVRNGIVANDEVVEGYEQPLPQGEIGTEVHFRPTGFDRWICIGFFADSQDSETGYILKSSAPSLSNPSECFNSETSEYRQNTVLLNSIELGVNFFRVSHFTTEGNNMLMTIDIEVEPTRWPESFSGGVAPKFFKQTVVSTQKLSWESLLKTKEGPSGYIATSYSFKRLITANNNTGGTLSNADILVTLDTASMISAGKMESDCSNIQFNELDSITPLSFWVEGGCNSASTNIWVRIPNMQSGGKQLYMYYGGTSAGAGLQVWDGGFTLMSTNSCSNGWIRNTDFDSRFARGASVYGETGGASMHSHAQVSCTSGPASAFYNAAYGSGGEAFSHSVHTHTGLRVDVNSAETLPPYLDMYFCSSSELTVSSGMVSMFSGSTPTGWTRFSALDDRFPRGASSYGQTGGAETHAHTTTGGYATGVSNNQDSNKQTGGSLQVIRGSHTHTTVNGTTDSGSSLPAYTNIIYGISGSSSPSTPGIIAIVDSMPPLGWERVSALDGRFARGASSYGGTGGSNSHSHSVTVSTSGAAGSAARPSGTAKGSVAGHTHSCSATTDTQSNIPPYVNSIFARRSSLELPVVIGDEIVSYIE